ncbi:MAG: glyoxalase [Pseudomonadota bacterium]|nr:glyoxalase [Pseudomonadota bacterium]
MPEHKTLKVRAIAGFGPIVRNGEESHKLYREVLGIAFDEETGGYLHTERVAGAKTFALWPLSQAARSCFGDNVWPEGLGVPQAWLEFEVDDVEEATNILTGRGYTMLVRNKTEPWGQVVSRLISPEGLLVGVTSTPQPRAAP